MENNKSFHFCFQFSAWLENKTTLRVDILLVKKVKSIQRRENKQVFGIKLRDLGTERLS